MAVAAQSWNNILSYIKMSLGAPLNMIELSDTDIIDVLKEHVLPVFSQYCPWKRWVALNSSNLIDHYSGQPMYQYKIPKPVDEPIIDILDVVFGSYGVKC